MSRSRGTAEPRPSPAPGLLVTAAFIGPGTVTACILAGANFGYVLLWVLVLATSITIVLQDMAVRLGVGARLGMGQAVLRLATSRWHRVCLMGLILVALGIGNAAFEAGNLTGALIGWQILSGDSTPDRVGVLGAICCLALILLLVGGMRYVQKVLMALVLIMSLAFLGAVVLIEPDLYQIVLGLIPSIPQEPAGAGLTTLALVGTTVVPYNLFLHAALARQRWQAQESTNVARRDSVWSIALGGLVSVSILLCAAVVALDQQLNINSPLDLAAVMRPIYGDAATWLLGLGLFAAGFTSALTAPLATGLIVRELWPGIEQRMPSIVEWVAALLVIIGGMISLLGIKPLTLILLAQVANGLLLPLLAGLLLWVMNKSELIGEWGNGAISNSLGAAVIVFCLVIAIRGIGRALGLGF